MGSEQVSVDAAGFKQAISRFASGVTIITTAWQGEMHGITASAFSSLSLDPLQILVCIRRESRLTEMISASGVFAVNILAAEHRHLSDHFARPGRPPAALDDPDLPFRLGLTGAPILASALAYIDCRLATAHPGGDHTIFIGDVHATGHADERAPLVYWQGAYREVATVS